MRNALASHPSGPEMSQRAFTLAELMVSMSIVVLAAGGVMVSLLFGLRLAEFSRGKLEASDDANRAVTLLSTEIHSARAVRVGNGDFRSFTEGSENSPQLGNAIQIEPCDDTNVFVRYFWDATDKSLKRMTNSAANYSLIASAITNRLVFTKEDFGGTVLTNRQNNCVIGVSLEFVHPQYPAASTQPGGLFDYYKIQTKISRRTDG